MVKQADCLFLKDERPLLRLLEKEVYKRQTLLAVENLRPKNLSTRTFNTTGAPQLLLLEKLGYLPLVCTIKLTKEWQLLLNR